MGWMSRWARCGIIGAMAKYFDINEQGCSIRCKLYCADAKNVRRVIVCCHGFGSSKDSKSYETFAERAVAKRKGTAVIVFDWPCHGDDARKNLRLDDCEAYIRLVTDYAHSHFGIDELYAYGVSFGGYLLLKYLAQNGNPFRKVALRCPALTMYRSLTDNIMAAGDEEKLKAGKPVLVGFDRKVKISPEFMDELAAFDVTTLEYFDYADDILIVQGTADEIVSFEVAREFADANVIEFVAVEGADHRFHDPKKMDLAISRILAFFECDKTPGVLSHGRMS